jgi:hypothetical protein
MKLKDFLKEQISDDCPITHTMLFFYMLLGVVLVVILIGTLVKMLW